MLVSFLESFKYLGHLYPVAFLRVYIGYYYLQAALLNYSGDFLHQPRIAEMIDKWLPTSTAPLWYQGLLESWAVPHWRYVAYGVCAAQFVVGLSLIIGYLVRPLSVLAIVLCLNFLWLSSPEHSLMSNILIAVHFSLAWIGAGRCLGVDYYFYKRMRGWLW